MSWLSREIRLPRASRWNPEIRIPFGSSRVPIPWKVRRLPRWMPGLLGACFLLLALAKPFGPSYLCGPSPFGPANTVMFFVELIGGYALLRRDTGRRLAAAVLAGAMLGSSVFLTRFELMGRDVSHCGCFGPVELSYAGHMMACAVLFSACAAVFLHEETLVGGPSTGGAAA